jgi:uncharacterized protein YegP (UPF0339 family)
VTAKFELYQDNSGQHGFCLRSKDGRILASRDGFASMADAISGIETMRSIAAAAAVLDLTGI